MLATEGDQIEAIAMVNVKSDLDKVTCVTWERVQVATHSEYDDLVKSIEDGSFPTHPGLIAATQNSTNIGRNCMSMMALFYIRTE